MQLFQSGKKSYILNGERCSPVLGHTDKNLASSATPMASSSGSSKLIATATASNTIACTALFLFTFLTASEPAQGKMQHGCAAGT